MDPGPRVEVGANGVARCLAGTPADYDLPPALRRSPLDPIQLVADELELAQPDN
jgi:hypothetical protein